MKKLKNITLICMTLIGASLVAMEKTRKKEDITSLEEQLASAKTLDEFIKTVKLYDALMVNEWSPLRAAAFLGNEKMVNLLLEEGVSIDEFDPMDRSTALHFAAEEGHAEIVGALLKKGANPNALSYVGYRSDWGYSPILEPLAAGNVEIVRLLLDNGTDPNIKQGDATKTEFEEGRDVRETLLGMAAAKNYVEIAELLLAAGADPKLESNGKKPIDIAREKGHQAMIALLEKK